jgi:hypothetical protein
VVNHRVWQFSFPLFLIAGPTALFTMDSPTKMPMV